MLRLVLAVSVVYCSSPAVAHDQLANGEGVPAWVKSQCCGVSDAHQSKSTCQAATSSTGTPASLPRNASCRPRMVKPESSIVLSLTGRNLPCTAHSSVAIRSDKGRPARAMVALETWPACLG